VSNCLKLFMCASNVNMESVQHQLERLMQVCADAELHFDDGVLPANSTMLSVFSNVLCDAVEVHTSAPAGDNLPRGSSTTSKTMVLPMQGLLKAQWLQAAPFWYPVDPAPIVQTWQEVELLLRIASQFDLRPVLQKAGDFLAANVGQLKATNSSSSSSSSSKDLCIWTWLLLADELRLSSSLPALISGAVEVDLAGCSNLDNTQGLSAGTLQRLLAAAATVALPSGKENTARYCTSSTCTSRGAWGRKPMTMYWKCPHCSTFRQ